MASIDLEAYQELRRAAERRGLRVVLIGAMARQIAFDPLHRQNPYRATHDIDVIVRVDGWNEYHHLRDELVEGSHFTVSGDHRMRYRGRTEVDMLPFGGVADRDGHLRWPRSGLDMSLDGFAAAEAHSEVLNVDGVDVHVASIASLVVLKLFAFREPARRASQDLPDVVHMLTHATDALRKRVYGELGGELAELDYDEAGPYLLGRDVCAQFPSDEVDALLGIIDSIVLAPPDYSEVSRHLPSEVVDRAIRLFEALRRGLRKA